MEAGHNQIEIWRAEAVKNWAQALLNIFKICNEIDDDWGKNLKQYERKSTIYLG